MATANPTPITPPRVPFLDERTGLISREWYMFFLGLFSTAQSAVNSDGLGSSAGSLAASLEQALEQLRQAALTQPLVSYTKEIDDLRQEVRLLPRVELGTMAALQQSNVPWITFDSTPNGTPTTVGTLAWDGGTTLGLQATAGVLMQLGESEYFYVKASSAITKGQVCYHTGSVGSSGVITAAPTPLALTDPNQIVGLAAEDIALNAFGLIQVSGTLRGFNTTGAAVGETWADGDPLYYNPAYVGALTKTKPSAPNQKTYIGEVINAGSGGSGSVSIRIVPGSVLGGTDSNVQFSSLADGDMIQYDGTALYWRNRAVTADRVLYASSTKALSTSSLLTFNGTNLGVGASATSTTRLYVKGVDTTASNSALYLDNSTPAALFYVRNDGLINTGLEASSPYNNTTGNAANVNLDTNGNLLRSTSSLRYKTDVQDAKHGLAEVLQLRSVTFKGKNDGDTIFGGLIAEEVHAAGLTEFVVYDDNRQPDALHYGNMVGLLVKAVQEQQALITDLKARVAALESR